MSKWVYAGFVNPTTGINATKHGRFVYFELDMFEALDVIPEPSLMVGVPQNGSFKLRAYWGNVQEQIAKDYNVTQQTVSRWIDEFKVNAAIEATS